jgi:hypothetical protein
VNVTETVQLALGASVAPHVVVLEKSAVFPVEMRMFEIESVPVPVLATVTLALLEEPSSVLGKEIVEGLTEAVATATPVPASATV